MASGEADACTFTRDTSFTRTIATRWRVRDGGRPDLRAATLGDFELPSRVTFRNGAAEVTVTAKADGDREAMVGGRGHGQGNAHGDAGEPRQDGLADFTPENWDEPQTVTVRGVLDDDTATVTHRARMGDMDVEVTSGGTVTVARRASSSIGSASG